MPRKSKLLLVNSGRDNFVKNECEELGGKILGLEK